jgi:hypothetical protein
VHQLLDLLTRQLAAAGELAEHPLAIGACLVDHLTTLLLGHDQFRLGVGGRILAATSGLDLGLFTQPLRLIRCLAQHA